MSAPIRYPQAPRVVIRTIPAPNPRPTKKRRIQADDTDRLYAAEHIQSTGGSQYLNKRPAASKGHVKVPASGLPWLSTIGVRVLARSFRRLFVNSTTGELRDEVRDGAELIKMLPPSIAERLLPAIVSAFATSTAAAVDISLFSLFLHSATTAFSLPAGGLPLKITRPLFDRLRACTNLTKLDLSGQVELTDRAAAHVLGPLRALRVVNFRGCTKVADEAVLELPAGIQSVNLGFTAVGARGLTALMARALDLTTLKLASVNGLTDAMVSKAIDTATEHAMKRRRTPLSKLVNLKVRGTAIGNAGIGKFLSLAPSIEHLDVRDLIPSSVDALRSRSPSSRSSRSSARRCWPRRPPSRSRS